MADQILQQTCGDIDAMTVAVICETCGKVKQSGRPCGYRRSSGGYSFDPAQRSGGATGPR